MNDDEKNYLQQWRNYAGLDYLLEIIVETQQLITVK